MAARKNYLSKSTYRFFSEEHKPPSSPDGGGMLFDFDESDLWGSPGEAAWGELKKSIPSSRSAKKVEVSAAASSLPVNIPDWSKILREGCRRRGFDDEEDDGDEEGEDGGRLPPHEYLARQLARTRMASFSVHEGIGRTLKGRDLSRVRNAIWEKTGFQD